MRKDRVPKGQQAPWPLNKAAQAERQDKVAALALGTGLPMGQVVRPK